MRRARRVNDRLLRLELEASARGWEVFPDTGADNDDSNDDSSDPHDDEHDDEAAEEDAIPSVVVGVFTLTPTAIIPPVPAPPKRTKKTDRVDVSFVRSPLKLEWST